MARKNLSEIIIDRWRIEAEIYAELVRRKDWIVNIPPVRHPPAVVGMEKRRHGSDAKPRRPPGRAAS